jgi:hypothetical protein
MIPIVPILIGLGVGYVANTVLNPPKIKEKTDAKILPDRSVSVGGDSASQQSPASDEDYRDRLTDSATEPETPNKEIDDEISSNRKAVPEIRRDRSSDDLLDKQLPDPEKPSQLGAD